MNQEALTRAVEQGDPIPHENCPMDGTAVYTGTLRGRPVVFCTGCGQDIAG
jgi:hypothetical protein